MATNKLFGRAEVVVNGVTVLNKEGASASGIGTSGSMPVEREPVYGDTGLHGYIEKPVPAKLEIPISDRSDILLSDSLDFVLLYLFLNKLLLSFVFS